MLSTKLSELILYVFQSFTSLVNAFNCINYNPSKAIKQPAYPETFFFFCRLLMDCKRIALTLQNKGRKFSMTLHLRKSERYRDTEGGKEETETIALVMVEKC